MRFSLCVDPGRPWAEVVTLARELDQIGWDGLYVCDHFMPYSHDGLPVDGPMLEGWTTLAALAGHTQRVRLGTLVLGSTYRHPAVVANMAAAMDHASGGRFVLGLGVGGQANEHAAYGIERRSTASRLDAFEEACAVIRSLLTNRRTTHHGDFFTVTDAPCDPAPVQAPLPMLIGGGGEKRTLRIAARFADEWHVWGTPEEFRRKSEILDLRCDEIDRDPSALLRVTGELVIVSNDASAHRDPTGDSASPAEVLDLVGAYRDAGADEFIVRDAWRTPIEVAQEALSLFWGEIAPHFRQP